MKDFDRNQIITALRIIKGECDNHDVCKECPFGHGEQCVLVQLYPDEWVINDGENWKAFR